MVSASAEAPARNGARSRYYTAAYSQVCRELLGVDVVRFDFPGGKSRGSIRLHLEDGRRVIATRREDQSRIILEEGALRHLGAQGAPVPRVLAFNGLMLLQEDLGNRRLSGALHGASVETIERLLDEALGALAAIHRAADAAGLDDAVLALGVDRDWVTALIDRPAVLGNFLEHRCPVPKLKDLLDLLMLVRPRFIKWDTRPGNAILRPQGGMAWIDWEDCGARNRLDDVAWLLGDEFVPDLPAAVEERLLARHLPVFADGMQPDDAGDYLAAFGTFHMCVRLCLILSERGEGEWWDHDHCLAIDYVGVTLQHAERLCLRAARWSARSSLTEMLSPWLLEVQSRLRQL